ncbi:hypothetical protein D3OALGB2SA_3342 [Olavius algarvensis associated proteobacterium Delta 3]|nr:hypothetical protein D3OALGB2SA_3342 [Olavius algarvensis associated proteobacterium Delta 3]
MGQRPNGPNRQNRLNRQTGQTGPRAHGLTGQRNIGLAD